MSRSRFCPSSPPRAEIQTHTGFSGFRSQSENAGQLPFSHPRHHRSVITHGLARGPISESIGFMDRTDLQRLSKDELIELVLRLQRPDKTSRTSSKPPSTDKKEKRENARPGGAKPGHEPHNRRLADDPNEVRDHRPTCCEQCGGSLSDGDMALIGEYDEIEIPPLKPHVVRHRRFACQCPHCGSSRKLRRPPSPRRRRSGRAFMRWRFISRVFRRSPMSVCASCSATPSG